MGNIAVSNDIYNNALEYAKRHDTIPTTLTETGIGGVSKREVCAVMRKVFLDTYY